MGEACNLKCDYCYQEPVREAGNVKTKYDLEKIIAEVEKTGQEFSMFGGEALLVPKKDLEYLFKYGFERYGRNSMQTNGTLIDDEHIDMFKKYNVSIGISIDGPNDLNGLRRVRGREKDDAKTLASTQTIMTNIEKLKKNGIQCSVIVTLHRVNGNPEALPRLINFIKWLGDIGIVNGNLHTLEVDDTMPDQAINVLTQEENAEVFLTLAKFFSNNRHLRWSPFVDMKNILNANDASVNCTWHFCDPMNTQAVYGIEGDAALSNCGRTNKEGIGWYKADSNQYGRYISMFNTPDELGGCKGCRFWMACGGSCPGESDNGDFRNKTIHCHTQKTLLSYYEDELADEGIEPISLSPMREIVEQQILQDMYHGNRPSISGALETLRGSRSRSLEIESREEE